MHQARVSFICWLLRRRLGGPFGPSLQRGVKARAVRKGRKTGRRREARLCLCLVLLLSNGSHLCLRNNDLGRVTLRAHFSRRNSPILPDPHILRMIIRWLSQQELWASTSTAEERTWEATGQTQTAAEWLPVRRQASGLTTYPLSLGVVNFEIIAEEIFHCDLLLLRQTVIFR